MTSAEYMRKYNATEKGAKYNREHVKKWRLANPEKRKEQAKKEAKRRSAKSYALLRAKRRNRVPIWDSELNAFAIDEIYKLAQLRTKITGVAWEVDHEVPLLGKEVSGLHVYNNLQLLPRRHNRQKGNGY
jgi:hypothetical protein